MSLDPDNEPAPRPDPQRKLVYVMELRELRGHWRHQFVKLGVARKVLRRHCRLYEVPQVDLLVRTERGIGASYTYAHDGKRASIWLGRKYGRNMLTLAHEFAHHVAFSRHGFRVADHGPSWARYYMQALHSMKLIPMAGTRELYRKYGIRWA